MSNEMYLEQNLTVLPKAAQRRIKSFYFAIRYFMPGTSVLDLGAGTGCLAELMRKDGFTVDEMDFYPRDQTVSKIDLNAPFLPKSMKLYHNVVLTHVIEHLEIPMRSLREIRNNYCTEGTVIALAWPDPSYPASLHRPFDKSIGHISPPDLVQVRSMFSSLGITPLLTGQFCSQPNYEELIAIGRCG